MRLIPVLLLSLGVLSIAPGRTRADGIPAKYKPAIQKGLAWLVKQQNKDGSWSTRHNDRDVACTALAGLALLMEGSTPGKGSYASNIREAADWIAQNCQTGADTGLIGPRQRLDQAGYMFDQSHALLFLASAYAREERSEAQGFDARLARVRQRQMEEILKRAVQFTAKAQSSSGGWFYTSHQDGHDQDEVSATVAQVLALRAAQQAGIELPKDTLPKAFAYLDRLTSPYGGLPLSSRNGNRAGVERPGFTIAAFAATLGSDQVRPELPKKWLGYCQFAVTPQSDTYARFHLAQAVHGLGEQGYAKLLGTKDPPMLWSKYREALFSQVVASQATDGSWAFRDWNLNPVFGTALSLVTLQLDNEHVPIFRAKKDW